MKNNPWNIDANVINLDDLDSSKLDSYIVKTHDIELFLESSFENKKMFLVGPKGVGKTLILKAKSQILRDTNKSLKFIPLDRLCEKFSQVSLSLSLEDVNKFTNREVWDKVWEMSILTLIIVRFKGQLPVEINNIIKKASDLSEILSSFLQNRGVVEKLYQTVNTDLRPTVREIQHLNQIAIFIDNIDEGFERHTGYSLKNFETGSSILSEKVWINVQNSIMQVAKEICNSFKHVKIFLSIRSESYINNNDSTKLQLDNYATEISYTYGQIKQIFENNILLTPIHDLADSKNQDVLSRITGYNSISHSFVEDINGEKQKESLFGFIYRHTFQRPREVMEMGSKIVKIPVKERTQENIRKVVNEVSYKLLSQLKTETIPYFEDEAFLLLVQKLRKNIITYETALEVYSEIKKEIGFDNVFSYFYRLGLIGFVDTDIEGNMMQKFLPVGYYSLTSEALPEYKYFLLHPTLNNEMKRFHQTDFYDQFNIVGYNYPFKAHKNFKKIKHMHFGLDRDSLAISIPELFKSKCLCVVVEPSQEWSLFEQIDSVTFQYNILEKIEFMVLKDNSTAIQKKRIENGFLECKGVLIYSNNKNFIESYIKECDTISFSKLPKEIIGNLSVDLSEKYIYYHQRTLERSKINDLNRFFKGKNAVVKPVLVDRFLMSCEQIQKTDSLVIDIGIESHGTFICPLRYPHISMRPSNIVIRTNGQDEFKFYRKRQHRLVEGVYQLYKLLKMKGLIPKDPALVSCIFNYFIYIQVRILMDKISDETLNNIFNGKSESLIHNQLHNYGLQTIQRTEQLAKKYPYSGMTMSVGLAKKKSFFPVDAEFYNYIRENNSLDDCDAVSKLHDILEVQPNSSMHSVFISYSFKDSNFAKKIANYLKINGCKTFLFQIDDPHKGLKDIMSQEISNYEKVLFIASYNSLTSTGCQYELTKCREKYEKSWNQILIPIRIDDYIFQVEKHQIPNEFREEYWKNILLIRENNIKNYSNFIEEFDCNEFQNTIKKLILDSLMKD